MLPERAPKTIAGCGRRGAVAFGRTSGARSSRGSTTLLAALRACGRIQLAPLGLAPRSFPGHARPMAAKRLRRSSHLSTFAHMGAVYLVHDLYGYLLQMSPDV